MPTDQSAETIVPRCHSLGRTGSGNETVILYFVSSLFWLLTGLPFLFICGYHIRTA